MNALLDVNPRVIIVNAKPIRSDLESAPVGIYDSIREDIRRLSTVQPVDRVFLERTNLSYRGIVYSNDTPYLFSLGGNGFIAKKGDRDDAALLLICARLEEAEQRLTAKFDAKRSSDEQADFNEEMLWSAPDDSQAGIPEDADPSTLKQHGPKTDTIERIPGNYRKTARIEISNAICGGGIVMHDGKVLLVKPTSAHGGYDWTLPKGHPENDETRTIDTAVREVKEETGLLCTIERKLGRFVHNDGGTCDYYVMTPIGGDLKPDKAEISHARWVTIVEALSLLNDDVDVRIISEANALLPTMIIKGDHKGTMVALHVPLDEAKELVIPDGEPAEDLHITLLYLGKHLTEAQKKLVATITRAMAGSEGQIQAKLAGIGRFSASAASEWRDIIYISIDSPKLLDLQKKLETALNTVGIVSASSHGFTPHMTLGYIEPKSESPIARFEPRSMWFDAIGVSVAGKRMMFPLRRQVLIKAERNVQKPGARGGKFWIDENNQVRYGERPGGRDHHVDENAVEPPARPKDSPVPVKRSRKVKEKLLKPRDWRIPLPEKPFKDNTGIDWEHFTKSVTTLVYGDQNSEEYKSAGKAVRETARALLEKHGMKRKYVLSKSDEVTVRRGDPSGTCYHHWNGSVELAETAARNLLNFAQTMVEKGDHVLLEAFNGMAVLLHEELHDISNMVPDAYVGLGVPVEEAATEIVARYVMREEFGDMRAHNNIPGVDTNTQLGESVRDSTFCIPNAGVYGNFIKPVADYLFAKFQPSNHDLTWAEVYDKLERGCIRVKKENGMTSYGSWAHVDQFAKSFQKELGKENIPLIEFKDYIATATLGKDHGIDFRFYSRFRPERKSRTRPQRKERAR